MPWPLHSHFASMLKNPRVAFRDPALRKCNVEMNHLGQPKARSGNFATVYRGFRPDGSEFAIRVFNRRQDERLQHYRAISEYLEGRPIASLVRFEYHEQGIRSAGDGKLYPLLTMQWVPGVTLFEWIRKRCEEDSGGDALLTAAEMWRQLVRELAEHTIVHGDLQHGNVLVSPEGRWKLVDYDCMGVPCLLGRRNLETGLPPYQHPGRNAATPLFSGLDRFSSLVIYLALRALSATPGLWRTYVADPSYDRILFRETDFREPRSSPLYQDLQRSPDRQVCELARQLFELPGLELHEIPSIDELLSRCPSAKASAEVQSCSCFRHRAFPRIQDRGSPGHRGFRRSGEKRGVEPQYLVEIATPSELEPVEYGIPITTEPPIVVQTSAPVFSPSKSQSDWVWWLVGSVTATLLVGILLILMLILGISVLRP